ncbi:MAG: hypothetical protein ABIN97_01755 [Ginsengibacter sp.]
MYFLLWFSYGIGSTLIGIPLLSGNLLAKIIGGCFIFYGVLSIIYFMGNYMGLKSVIKPVDFVFEYVYPWMQSSARFATGVWLWKYSEKRWVNL